MSGKKRIRIALVGRTGHGKSSTGNTVLRKETFEDTDSAGKGTVLLEKKTSEIDGLLIQVFDTPGLGQVDKSVKKDKEWARKDMKELMEISGGIDVFLLVLNHTSTYTHEERKVVTTLEEIFGKTKFDDHGIIVVTHGDTAEMYLSKEKQETVEDWVHSWCNRQPESFQQLLKAMNNRIVLVNNRGTFEDGTSRMKSSQKLLEMAAKLQDEKEPYAVEDLKQLETTCCVIC